MFPKDPYFGPLLFLIYVNDLNSVSNTLDRIMFANDANLFYFHKNINQLFTKVNEELEKIEDWFKAKKIPER